MNSDALHPTGAPDLAAMEEAHRNPNPDPQVTEPITREEIVTLLADAKGNSAQPRVAGLVTADSDGDGLSDGEGTSEFKMILHHVVGGGWVSMLAGAFFIALGLWKGRGDLVDDGMTTFWAGMGMIGSGGAVNSLGRNGLKKAKAGADAQVAAAAIASKGQ